MAGIKSFSASKCRPDGISVASPKAQIADHVMDVHQPAFSDLGCASGVIDYS
jgi:hypothetical protein